jgi:hypothetical protein
MTAICMFTFFFYFAIINESSARVLSFDRCDGLSRRTRDDGKDYKCHIAPQFLIGVSTVIHCIPNKYIKW